MTPQTVVSLEASYQLTSLPAAVQLANPGIYAARLTFYWRPVEEKALPSTEETDDRER